jgi:hypothetical protein
MNMTHSYNTFIIVLQRILIGTQTMHYNEDFNTYPLSYKFIVHKIIIVTQNSGKPKMVQRW